MKIFSQQIKPQRQKICSELFLKLATVIVVGIEVGCDDHTVAKLSSGERLLRMLAIQNGIEFNKNLTTSGHVDT